MEVRTYPKQPIVGVGAIVVGNKGLLFVRRDKDPGKGLWSIPGGVVEVGETQQEAIIREVEEETGIKIELIEMIGTYDLIRKDSQNLVKFHFVLIHYLARAFSAEIRPESPDSEVCWFSIDHLPENEMPPQLLDLIKRNTQKITNIHIFEKRQEV
jgi:mutator protein MutT